jgi:hypothetical protein
MVLRDGSSALFWEDSWLNGQYLQGIAPDLFVLILKCPRKRRMFSSRWSWTGWFGGGGLTASTPPSLVITPFSREQLPQAFGNLEHLHTHARRGLGHSFFSSGRRKSVQSGPRILVFARIWAFIHPASPGHPGLPGRARGLWTKETRAKRRRKFPRVAWPRLGGESGRSSSSSSCLPRIIAFPARIVFRAL